MKRAALALFAGVNLLLLPARAGHAAEPGSPEAVVGKAMDDFNHGRVDKFVEATHPEAMAEIRAMILELCDAAAKRDNDAQLLAMFPGVKDVGALKALDAANMYTLMLGSIAANPEVKKALAASRVETLGHVDEGADTTHVVYRSTVKLGAQPITRLYVSSLRKSGPDWKLSLLGDLAAQLPAMRRNLAGDLTLPRLDGTRVEVLGSVPDKKRDGLVVYRASVPVGDTFLNKMAVKAVSKSSPAWKALRAGKPDGMVALIKQDLGVPAAPPEARKERPRMTPRADRTPKTPPRVARSPARKKATTRRQPPGAAPAELPEGLTALPPTFFGGDRDRFYDVGPEGGVLVGVRVSYVMRFGGPKVSSVQPVFRVGEKLVNGKRHGGLLGKETTAVAKPGYAVGAINTHTGLTVDGFELVFMKVDGDHLDPDDSYKSPWLGDKEGGSPRDVSGDGKTPVGLQGRAGREINALGLIVGE
jgi:hypothetical protein